MAAQLTLVKAKRLAASGPRGSIAQTAPQAVEVRWGRIILQMRPIDLCVLNQELARLLGGMKRDATETYVLSLNRQELYLPYAGLWQFKEMVEKATDQLPHHVIRWQEIELSIRPACSHSLATPDRFTPN
jgi:hypothetical protein